MAGQIKNKIEDFLTREETNSLVGNKVLVKCVKNKVGLPGRTVEIRNRYGLGFDNGWTALQILLSRKLISRSGAWYNFYRSRTPFLLGDANGMRLQGEQAVMTYMDDNPAWRDALISQAAMVISEIDSNSITEVVEDDEDDSAFA